MTRNRTLGPPVCFEIRAVLAPSAAALCAFLLALAVRWQHGFANVDDYLYARQAHEFARALANGPAALVEAWRAFGQNAPLVPTLAAPLAAIDPSPHLLTLAQLPFVLLLAAGCTVLLRALGLAGARLALAAAAAASAPPLLAWAAMFHFAFASAALTVAALAAYIRSRGLRSLVASAAFGLAIGLLCVARVIGPLYAGALIAAVAGDQLTRHGDWRERLRGALVACSSAVLVATPWWAAAGASALRYLTTAGYGESPFTHEAGLLGRARERFDWTANESGWLVAIALLALTALGLLRALRNDRSRRPALLMAITALFAMIGLATSTNAGTGFALPAIALAVCLAAFAVAAPPQRRIGRPAAGTRLAGLSFVVLAGVAYFSGWLALLGALPAASVAQRPLWQLGPPGLQQARSAMGCECEPPNSDRLARRVLAVVSDKPTLLARDDALLNAESLRFAALRSGRPAPQLLAPPSQGPALTDALARARYVVAGRTLAPYHAVDGWALLAGLARRRFRPVFTYRISQANDVTVYAAPRGNRRSRR